MIIKKKELHLRSAIPTDTPLLAKWWGDGSVMAHAGFPNGIKADVDQLIKRLQKQQIEHNVENHLLMIVFRKKPIGEMNFRCHRLEPEIGIKICEAEYQNQGIGRKALKGVISYLFDELKMEVAILDTNLKNKRAQHVHESIGFLSTSIRYQAFNDQLGVDQDVVYYQMTKERYLGSNWRSVINQEKDEIYGGGEDHEI